jgi:hypothetical protein
MLGHLYYSYGPFASCSTPAPGAQFTLRGLLTSPRRSRDPTPSPHTCSAPYRDASDGERASASVSPDGRVLQVRAYVVGVYHRSQHLPSSTYAVARLLTGVFAKTDSPRVGTTPRLTRALLVGRVNESAAEAFLIDIQTIVSQGKENRSVSARSIL